MKNSNRNNIKLNSTNFDNVLNNIIDEISYSNSDDQMDKFDNIELNNNDINLNDNDINIIEESNFQNPTENSLLNKLDLMTLNNGWNDKNEKIVISIGENASSYKWMHEKSASMYKLIHKIFSIVLILFSTGLSAESIIPDDQSNVAISVLRRIFTYIITVLSILQNFLKMEQLSEQHMSAATRYSELYHDIQKQMCMFRKDRNNAIQYLSNVLKRYDSLVVAGPNIDSIVLNQFKTTFKNAEISIPDIADRIQKIEIITEPNTIINMKNMSDNNNNNNNNHNNNKNKSLDNKNGNDLSNKRYARFGNSNLKQIHDVFKIQGDLTDSDIQNANNIELKELRKKFLDGKLSFEYDRFKKHNTETD